MKISKHFNSTNCIFTIKVKGNFDFSAIQEFKDAYMEHSDEIELYRIDLEKSTYIDTAALGILCNLRKHAADINSEIEIINCCPDVIKIIQLSRLNELMKVQ